MKVAGVWRIVAVLAVAAATAACSRAPLPTEVAATDTGSTPSGRFDGFDAPDRSDGDGSSTSTTLGELDLGEGAEPGQPGSAPGPDSGSGGGDSGGTTIPGQTGPVLFPGDEATRGITDDSIVFCAHAALTYGAAFNTSAEDLNVYWTAVNEAGGVHGRRVEVYYENDNYSPDTAIEAAKNCRDQYDPFALLGGIGFDQIPAVRNWAEENRMLYLHHTATVNGSAGKQYSFSPLTTTEKMGEMFAELAASRFPGQAVGIVKRQSPNWEPGIDGFKKVAASRGVEIAAEREVSVNQGSYLQDIVELRNAGSEVVFLWLNALESTEFVGQTWAQGWQPQFMVFPFNIMTQTLGAQSLDPPIVGLSMHNAYSAGDYSGPFAPYADDMALFEQQYDNYRPNADYRGVGGDLMFLNWASQKVTHQFLLECGPDCDRNRFAQLLRMSKGSATTSVCPVDFTRPDSGDGHRGGYLVSSMEAYRTPTGEYNFRNDRTCVEHL